MSLTQFSTKQPPTNVPYSIHVTAHFTSSNGYESTESGMSSIKKHFSKESAIKSAVWMASYHHVYKGGTYDWTYTIENIEYQYYATHKDYAKLGEKPNLRIINRELMRKKKEPKDLQVTPESYSRMFKTSLTFEQARIETLKNIRNADKTELNSLLKIVKARLREIKKKKSIKK